ncbi:MAG: hypothetical protein AVDCRST_MAG26-3885 [uncultured Chloroflexia bacterium]|uniref:Uncharacterized protein n=1 Tax=uncultured Chloroflexia bacterium TaxID=1672391 RepID=A0A6J4JV46_9CHLR|nr:MAG: hypothetical protein AVDCRST_MAG26-3885 [uncultured Chloroflexia bacterium]
MHSRAFNCCVHSTRSSIDIRPEPAGAICEFTNETINGYFRAK